MATILEALYNAQCNLDTVQKTGMYQLLPLTKEQLKNVMVLLSKGYDVEDEIEPLLEKYGTVEHVPNLDTEN